MKKPMPTRPLRLTWISPIGDFRGRLLTAVAACLLLAAVGGWADELSLSGQTYTLLRQARHEHYRFALTLRPAPSAKQISALDIVLAYQDASNYGRLVWGQSGFRLERVVQGEQQPVVSGEVPLFAELAAGGELVIKRRERWLEIIGAGRRLVRVLDSTLGAGALGLARGEGGPGVAEVRYQRVEPLVFGDDFMRTEDEATDFGVWEPVYGAWRLYSVMEQIRANPDARIREGREPLASRSVNPFCLSGHSEQGAVILAGYPFWDDYRFGVSVKSLGSEFGLVFGALDADNFWLARWRLSSVGVRAGRVELVRRSNGRDEVIAAASALGRTGNWYRFEVRAVGSSVEVLIDGVVVIGVRDDRSVGGRIGLYACSEDAQETFFDDVRLRSWQSVRFADAADLAGHGEARHGEWTTSGDSDRLEFRSAGAKAGLLRRAPQAEYLLGYPSWRADCVRATVTPEDARAGFGLLFAYRGENDYWQASWSPESGGTLALRRVQDRTETLMDVALPREGHAPCELMLDTRDGKAVKVFCDGELALRYPCAGTLQGRLGLFAVSGHGVSFRRVEAFAEPARDWEHPVNVDIFTDDPFMQGWASPRWAWLPSGDAESEPGTPRVLVHKGDFYGAFRLTAPVTDGLEFYFGLDVVDPDRGYQLRFQVDDGLRQGTATLNRGRKQLAAAEFAVQARSIVPGKQVVDEKIGPLPRTPDTVTYGDMTLNRDGNVFWLEANGVEVFSTRDEVPLRGRTLAMRVVEPIDLLHVSVVRSHVKDYLFEEAPTDWLSIGTWEVTNRFACDPRWSHMNGRSKGLAALWNKFAFDGDFTVECYAGMRMRQGDMLEGVRRNYYPRVGDINVSVNAEAWDLFSGYNVIFAAWDSMWSEKWTQFWRQEKLLERTEREFIPRGREARPTARVIEVDWDPGGRPVHGAWYYIKVRKTGTRYEVSFDNVPVFAIEDPDPLAGRRIALWSQQNSIVIARAKIGYSKASAASVDVLPEPASASYEPERPDTAPSLHCLSHPGWRFDFETGNHGWEPFAGDQSAELIGVAGSGERGRRSLMLRNVYAGGDFGVRLPVTGLDLGRVMTLGMDCAVPEGVKVNLYVKFQHDPIEWYFISLSGPDHEAPNLYRLGRFRPIQADGTWQHVEFEPAAELLRRFPWQGKFVVDTMVLGMLHEGYLNAGLAGNKGGAAWSLDNVAIASIGPADVAFEWRGVTRVPLRYKVWSSQDSPSPPPPATLQPRSDRAFSWRSTGPGFHAVHVAYESDDGHWRRLPEVPLWVDRPLAVAATRPTAGSVWAGEPVVIRFAGDRRVLPDLSEATLLVGGEPVALDATNATYDSATRQLTVRVKGSEAGLPDGEPVEFVLRYADSVCVAEPVTGGAQSGQEGTEGKEQTAAVRSHRWQATVTYAGDKTPPSTVRLGVDQLVALDFNDGLDGVKPYSPESGVKLLRVPREGNSRDFALRILNRLCGSDSGVTFGVDRFFAGKFPILALDYRADEHARADFMIKRASKPVTLGFLGRDMTGNTKIGDIPDVNADGKWHHAEVNLVELMGTQEQVTDKGDSIYRVNGFALGDWGYAAMPAGVALEIDNVALVPVIGTLNGYEMKWSAADMSGIRGYSYQWDSSADVELDQGLDTTDSSAVFRDLPDGLLHFRIRAQDGAGNWGPPSSYRFLVDNTPPAIAAVTPAADSRAADSSISLRFGESVSQIDPSSIKLMLNGKKCSLSAYTTSWDTASRDFSWDMLSAWRVTRAPVANGKAMTVRVTGVSDFAGNTAEPYEWTWYIDYSKDKEGPLSPRIWSYTHDFRYYDHFSDKAGYWRPYGGNNAAQVSTVVDPDTGDSCLLVEKSDKGRRFSVYRYRGKLDLAEYPLVSFDCKIMPEVKVNLLLYVDRQWHVVRMTGAADAADAGSVEEAQADGKWHHLVIDLREVLAKAMPDTEVPEIRMVALGEWRGNTNEVGARFYVDNFAFVGPGSPMPVVSCTAADVTGIAAYQVSFDRDPWGTPATQFEPSMSAPIGAVDEAGLWFIHLRGQDGAGNWGGAVHYPYWCTAPVATGGQEGIEAEKGWSGYSRERRTQCTVQAAQTVDGQNDLLAASLYAAGESDMLVQRRSRIRLRRSATVFADFYHHGEHPIKISAFVLPGLGSRRVVSKAVEVPGRSWARGVRFKLDLSKAIPKADSAAKSAVFQDFGFVISTTAKVRTSLLIDDVRVKGRLALASRAAGS